MAEESSHATTATTSSSSSSGYSFVVKDANKLKRVAKAILAAAGSSDEEAEVVASHLVESNLKGHDSHGVGMIPKYIASLLAGKLHPNKHPILVNESNDGPILVFDGQMGYGQIVGKEAISKGIERARVHGVAVVALRNTHHLCRIGTYAEQCLKEGPGFVSISLTNVAEHGPLVAPYGGSDPRIGTNPVTIGVPQTDPEKPVVLDMATSVGALGKVREMRNKGEEIPDGWLLDSTTRRGTNDADVMFRPIDGEVHTDKTISTEPDGVPRHPGTPSGALRPFGSYKGSGLGLMCELLGGALTGGSTFNLREDRPLLNAIQNNMLTIIINPGSITDATTFQSQVAASVAWFKASPPEAGKDGVLTPGEPERSCYAKRSRDGIEIDICTWGLILSAGEAVGVDKNLIDEIEQ